MNFKYGDIVVIKPSIFKSALNYECYDFGMFIGSYNNNIVTNMFTSNLNYFKVKIISNIFRLYE